MRKSLPLAALCLLTMSAGCVWQKHDEDRQLTARSYLRPIGKTAGTAIQLEGKTNYSFTIQENRGESGKRYGIEPGTYQVTVRRAGQVVIARTLFVADGETRELPVR